MAVQVLKARGVPEDHILFLNVIASPEGVHNFATKFPKLRVVTAFIDQVRQIPFRLLRSTHVNSYHRVWTRRSIQALLTHCFKY